MGMTFRLGSLRAFLISGIILSPFIFCQSYRFRVGITLKLYQDFLFKDAPSRRLFFTLYARFTQSFGTFCTRFYSYSDFDSDSFPAGADSVSLVGTLSEAGSSLS